MKRFLIITFIFLTQLTLAQDKIDRDFANPPVTSRPWVFWYWMQGNISKTGITADLKAMKKAGIAGAYLMPIKDTMTLVPKFRPLRQLTPEWWQMIGFAISEAKRYKVHLGMHVSDGFALAGGPWIRPEQSMQKLVWSKTVVKASQERKPLQLAQPETREGFYRDIAVFAYPVRDSSMINEKILPVVTTSTGARCDFLADAGIAKETFRADSSAWIRYEYSRPFTCRSITIYAAGNNYQSQRLIVEASDDGQSYRLVKRLEPPRHGWQDTDQPVTHSVPVTTARFYRFVYDKDLSLPGSEDLDAAKWRPSLRVSGIRLSGHGMINQFEGKNGSVWRVSKMTDSINADAVIDRREIIQIKLPIAADGLISWTPPPGNWVIIRIGHTSTGHTNATGGGGRGLECDKFSAQAVKLQYDNWFARVYKETDRATAREVLKVFHVDSWECGSQNWSADFATEFKRHKGYDLIPWLPVMAGIPVGSIDESEKFLHDVRETIAWLVNERFYKTLRSLAHKDGLLFSAESIAPTMLSDGILHYGQADIPMGEFWLRSPTHDKPNDMLDAISGAHIYGKNIVQAEAFTSVRMNWSEHPGMLKPIGDRNFALGINKMVIHVFMHNPWPDRKPGMTLDGVGLYYQRDQTWFNQSRAWIDYLARCQAMLQYGRPVADIAVFTGEELPSRSVLPDRLVETLPGIMGEERVAEERIRLRNAGQPLRTIPEGVTHSANMADPEAWIDPLNGYSYDCINRDALLQLATVKDGKIVLPGGASYSLLVIPSSHPLMPNKGRMSVSLANKLASLAAAGASIMIEKTPYQTHGLSDHNDSLRNALKRLWKFQHKLLRVGDTSFRQLPALSPDVVTGAHQNQIAWTHRKTEEADIYFLSNQSDSSITASLSFRVSGKIPFVYDPVTGSHNRTNDFSSGRERTGLSLEFAGGQSFFIVFKNNTARPATLPLAKKQRKLTGRWTVNFDRSYGGPAEAVVYDSLSSWTTSIDPRIRNYSGTAVYIINQDFKSLPTGKKTLLSFTSIENIATVRVNGIDCGTVWTKPYVCDITKALKAGTNKIEISVTNTWANRLIADLELPEPERVAWTTAPLRLKGQPFKPAGLIGDVYITEQ